ncbi:hypothetical protein LF817_13130 [Halobacillus sp. A1]|nr:hypothetical protein [Halobacillus sp. A1]MCP3032284.1 hypothetical protein [Halobacillus sp. A1]
MIMNLIILASVVIWIAAIYELIKPSKEQNSRKLIALTSVGTLSTLIITLTLFEDMFKVL